MFSQNPTALMNAMFREAETYMKESGEALDPSSQELFNNAKKFASATNKYVNKMPKRK